MNKQIKSYRVEIECCKTGARFVAVGPTAETAGVEAARVAGLAGKCVRIVSVEPSTIRVSCAIAL